MKYNFVYDTDVLKNLINLSAEEIDVVLATLIGSHNAIFYGHEPERLVDAIKKLESQKFYVCKSSENFDETIASSNNGIMYLKNLGTWSFLEQKFLYGHTLNDDQRKTQFIATTTEKPRDCVEPDILNNFDIVYKCKPSFVTPHNTDDLVAKLDSSKRFQCGLISGKHCTSTSLAIDEYWMLSNAYTNISKLSKTNPVYARKIAMVARSLSDISNIYKTTTREVEKAKALYEE